MVLPNPRVVPSPRIKIYLFLLSICIDELMPATNIVAFFPKLPSVNKNSERESSPMS